MTRTVVGIVILAIGLASLYLNVNSYIEHRAWLEEHMPQQYNLYGAIPEPNLRGGSMSDMPSITAPQAPSWIAEFVDNLNADRVLNWIANSVTIITGILLILRRRKED